MAVSGDVRLPPIQEQPPWDQSSIALGGMICLWSLVGTNEGGNRRIGREMAEIEITPPAWFGRLVHETGLRSFWKVFADSMNSALQSFQSSEASTNLEWSCHMAPGSTLETLNLT